MKKILCFLLLTATLAPAQELSKEETTALLDKMSAARGTSAVEMNFREEKHLSEMQKPVIESGTLAFLPPNQFRREIPDQSVMVSNGKTLWLYYPSLEEVEKYDLEKNRPLRDSLTALTSGLSLQNLTKNYSIRASKLAEGYRVELVPKVSALRRAASIIVLDLTPDLTARRMEVRGDSAKERTITTFTNERRTKLTPADFDFQPPAGATVSEPSAD